MAYDALIVEGFDHYGITAGGSITPLTRLAERGWSGGTSNTTIETGPIAGGALEIHASGDAYHHVLDPSGAGSTYSKVLITCRVKLDGTSLNFGAISLDVGSAGLTNLRWNMTPDATGHLLLRRGSTTIATSTGTITFGQWFHLEMKLLLATTAAGSTEVKINGVVDAGLTTSGVQTINTGLPDTLVLAGGGSGGNGHYDDLVVQNWNTAGVDYLGDVRVSTLYPSGAGNSAQFTPLSGSNYANVNESAADGDTTYNSSTTTGNRDSFALDNLPVAGTPYIVQATTEFRKADAGSRQLKNSLRISGTAYDGTAWTASDGWAMKSDIWNSDPSGGAWSSSAIDAAELGYKDHA